MKIAAYTIALNEIQFVDRWVKSVRDCDVLVVADTGSTDGTIESLKEKGVKVTSIKIKPWRFDDARNIALSLVPEDVDVCISLDMDEMMVPGWREELAKHWVSGTTKLRYSYTHNFDEFDNPVHTFMADKIHSRFGYRWKRPVHETIFPIGDEQIVTAPSVCMWHKQDLNKSRGQYLPLLELSHKEIPDDTQLCYWLAREYAFHNQNENAVEYFKKYLDMNSGWADERSEAMNWLSKLLPHEQLKWLRLSCAEAPMRRESWVNLADHFYGKSDWVNLYAAAKEGLKITTPSGSYLDNPEAWGGKLWDLAGLGAWNIGLQEESLKLFENAHSISPKDERIKHNYQIVKNLINGGIKDVQ